MSDKLKACPFCGEKPGADGGHVFCENMECHNDAELLEKVWNTRPIEDALRESAEILKSLEGQAQDEVERLSTLLASREAALESIRDFTYSVLLDGQAVKEMRLIARNELEPKP